MTQSELERARSMWAYRGVGRPPWAIEPEADQESVWDYPRPPRLDPDVRLVRVMHQGILIAETRRAVRVLETASPPTFYLPPTDVKLELLEPGRGASHCEWKGRAAYWSIAHAGAAFANVGWSYPEPYPEFEPLRDYLSFYPGRLDCFVEGNRVEPQPGGFYGGWVTPDVVGPFKGEPGTAGW